MRLFINIQIKIFSILFVVIFISYSGKFYAQDITFEPHDTFLYDTLGHEIIFYIDVTNVSKTDQTVFIVRTLDDLPPDWTSSLCFDLCFAPTVDSIATTVDYGSEPLTPGETREVSLHVFTQNNDGTANIQLQAGTFQQQRFLLMLMAKDTIQTNIIWLKIIPIRSILLRVFFIG